MAMSFNPYQHRMPSFQRPPPRNFAVDPRGFKGGPRRRPNPFMNRGIGGFGGMFGGRGPRRRFNPFMGMRRPRRRSAFSNMFGGIGGLGGRRQFNPFMNQFGGGGFNISGGGFNPFMNRFGGGRFNPFARFGGVDPRVGKPIRKPWDDLINPTFNLKRSTPEELAASRQQSIEFYNSLPDEKFKGIEGGRDAFMNEYFPPGPPADSQFGNPMMEPHVMGGPDAPAAPPPIMYGGGTPDFDEMGSTAPVMPAAPQPLAPVIPEMSPAPPTVGGVAPITHEVPASVTLPGNNNTLTIPDFNNPDFNYDIFNDSIMQSDPPRAVNPTFSNVLIPPTPPVDVVKESIESEVIPPELPVAPIQQQATPNTLMVQDREPGFTGADLMRQNVGVGSPMSPSVNMNEINKRLKKLSELRNTPMQHYSPGGY